MNAKGDGKMLELADSVKSIMCDGALRDSVVTLLERDAEDDEPPLPYAEARDYARARLMAQIAQAETVEFMFALWDEIWGPHKNRLGSPLPPDHKFADSLMPAHLWGEEGISVAFHSPPGSAYGTDAIIHLCVYLERHQSSVMVFLVDQNRFIPPPEASCWESRPATKQLYLGAITRRRLASEDFADGFEGWLLKMKVAAEEMIGRLATGA